MGKTYAQLDDKLTAFIKAQKLFFVASAPLNPDGHVNVSPKGYDSLVVLDEKTVAYIDLGGSGIETQAHCRENGRITLMFCAFEGAGNIVRIYGRGEAIDFGQPGFADLMVLFPAFERARAIIKIHIETVMDSCGWGVPFFDYKGEREQLHQWVGNKPLGEWKEKRYAANATSLDGLPGLTRPDGNKSN